MPKPRGGGTVKKGTVHHCPREGKGSGQCVYVKDGGVPFCREHCYRCDVPGHGNAVMMHFQVCPKCERAEQLPLQEAARERAEEIALANPKLQKFAKRK